MNNKKLPLLFILDLDLTLIGNSIYIQAYSDILNFINNYCKHNKFEGDICKIKNNKKWTSMISNNFLRLNIKNGLNQIKKLFPNAEFFIFSNGTKSYVKKIIPYIEKETNIKFNKLLITRDLNIKTENFRYEKNISPYIKNLIIKALIPKYSKTLIEKNKDLIFNYRLLIIDDVKEYWNNHPNLIICKPYNYTPIIEFDNEILNIIWNNQQISNYIINNEYNQLFPIINTNNKIDQEIKMDYHLNMANIYRQNIELNKNALENEGDLFQKLIKFLKLKKDHLKPFNSVFFENLNKDLLKN